MFSNTTGSKRLLPLVTGAAVALIGANLVTTARYNAADTAIDCVQEEAFRGSAFNDEDGLRVLNECRRDAKQSGIGLWTELIILAVFGWGAGALGYSAGSSETAEKERRRALENYRREQRRPPQGD
jgi:hypothetical protein